MTLAATALRATWERAFDVYRAAFDATDADGATRLNALTRDDLDAYHASIARTEALRDAEQAAYEAERAAWVAYRDGER